MAATNNFLGLANNISQAVGQLAPGDSTGWTAVADAIEKLRRAAEPATSIVSRQGYHTLENLNIIAAEEMGLFDVLCANEGQAFTALELAQSTGYDQTMTVRVMRIITAIGFADEVASQKYKANATTIAQNSPGIRGTFVLMNDVMFALASNIRRYYRENKPCRLEDTMPAYDFATGESIWQSFQKTPELKKSFDTAMTGQQKMYSKGWHKKFPIKDFVEAAGSGSSTKPVVVDIGGNEGVDLQRIADTYPDLQCRLVLQDRPETIARLPSTLSPRIEPAKHDFFTEQPIRGAAIYQLKSVLHDWDDASSLKILSNTAKAMDHNSRLLVHDMVLADVNEPAYGANTDMLMAYISNGMERTKSQWEKLIASVTPPLTIVKFWSVPGDTQSILETRLA